MPLDTIALSLLGGSVTGFQSDIKLLLLFVDLYLERHRNVEMARFVLFRPLSVSEALSPTSLRTMKGSPPQAQLIPGVGGHLSLPRRAVIALSAFF